MLLQIWPQVRASYPDAVLLIVGSGPLEGELQMKASAGVKFVGGQEDVAAYLKQSDCFVLCSDSEGLPVALLEAMSCGLPIVASNVGGIPQVVQDEVHGTLIPKGDPAALAVSLIDTFAEPAKASQMGAEARRCILSRYSADFMADQLIALYQTVLQNRGAK
jgi:glycosyltransferase involved in cell wall biosynthesis